MNSLIMNPTYIKGNRRAGCLVCPRAAERNDFMNNYCYKDESEKFINIIRHQYREKFSSSEQLEQFITSGGWKARKNGRDLSLKLNYKEAKDSQLTIIQVEYPKTDWREWIKSIGELLTEESPFVVLRHGKTYTFNVTYTEKGYDVSFNSTLSKDDPEFVKLLKEVFRKAACCVGCKECAEVPKTAARAPQGPGTGDKIHLHHRGEARSGPLAPPHCTQCHGAGHRDDTQPVALWGCSGFGVCAGSGL